MLLSNNVGDTVWREKAGFLVLCSSEKAWICVGLDMKTVSAEVCRSNPHLST